MSFLSDPLQTVDAAIQKLHNQIATTTNSDIQSTLNEKLNEMKILQELMVAYNQEVVGEQITGLPDKKYFKTLHEITYSENSTSSVDETNASLLSETHLTPEQLAIQAKKIQRTIETVNKYMKKFNKDYPATNWYNFCEAAACSFFGKYTFPVTEKDINDMAAFLFARTGMDNSVQLLSLADVDRVIHESQLNREAFIVLDTSLQVILTNVSIFTVYGFYMLIYDVQTGFFAPVSRRIKNGTFKIDFVPSFFSYFYQTKEVNVHLSHFCRRCIHFLPILHECQPHCPICLRPGDSENIGCLKRAPDAKPWICSTCNAFCQSKQCFEAHLKICPRPCAKLGDDIVEMIESFKL